MSTDKTAERELVAAQQAQQAAFARMDAARKMIALRETERAAGGPPCSCGRKGWVEVSRCNRHGCGGQALAKFKLKEMGL